MDGQGIVTLGIASREEASGRLLAALRGEGNGAEGARITFASYDLLWRVLTPRRLGILEAMAGQGPLPIRAVARRVGRDVKAVHGDVHALLDAGLLEGRADGVAFPYREVRVDVRLRAA